MGQMLFPNMEMLFTLRIIHREHVAAKKLPADFINMLKM